MPVAETVIALAQRGIDDADKLAAATAKENRAALDAPPACAMRGGQSPGGKFDGRLG